MYQKEEEFNNILDVQTIKQFYKQSFEELIN